MPSQEIKFIGPAYELPAYQLDAQSCINWYITQVPDGKTQVALLPRPGLTLFSNDNNEHYGRGALQLNDKAYVVIDNSFYIYDSNGTRVKKGTLNTSTGRIKIIANDYQIGIFDGEYGYIYQLIESETREKDSFFLIENATPTVEDPVFQGTGTDDLSTNGTYTGSLSTIYRIKISNVGTPNKFQWSDDGGVTYKSEEVSITGLTQKLNNGFAISFINTIGHTLNDFWDIQVILDSVFYPPIYPTCQNGIGIYIKQNSNTMYSTAINDFSQIDALDYANANIYQDYSVASIAMQTELYIVKKLTIEVWNYTGQEGFPFLPRASFTINYGCPAAHTIIKCSFNVLLMLAQNQDGVRKIIKVENYRAIIISNEALENEIGSYDIISDAYAEIVEKNNHIFYIITFPSADKTWVYDLKTNNWFRWSSYNENESPYQSQYKIGAFRGSFHIILGDKDIFGDTRTGKLFEFTNESYKDYDYPILFERTSQHLYIENKWITINSLMIDVERAPSVDNTSSTIGETNTPPVIGLRISRDGGKSWGSEIFSNLGKVGEYKKMALFTSLGTSKVFTFKVRITDTCYSVILSATADIEVFD